MDEQIEIRGGMEAGAAVGMRRPVEVGTNFCRRGGEGSRCEAAKDISAITL